MTTVFLLTDYKGSFGSKITAKPYRSGFDKTVLANALRARGLDPVFLPFAEVNFRDRVFTGEVVLYTSSEDAGEHYKSFLEDVVLGLQWQGARLVPRFELLRAHHNKVFMEMLRDLVDCPEARSVRARYFGTVEDLERTSIATPVVVKPAAGSMSDGVRLALDRPALLRAARTTSRSHQTASRARDIARTIRRPGYRPESWNRRKFVVQDFIPGLDHDWKVLVYGTKLYVLRRGVRAGDFRASGSGKFSWPEDAPAAVLDLAWKLVRALDVPWLAADIAVAGGVAHVIEFQVIYFGTLTLEGSPGYYEPSDGGWRFHHGRSVLEDEFAAAVVEYLKPR
jgi:glutathione synthase/RimK-type ligase-like ATP-grasp enzyme